MVNVGPDRRSYLLWLQARRRSLIKCSCVYIAEWFLQVVPPEKGSLIVSMMYTSIKRMYTGISLASAVTVK